MNDIVNMNDMDGKRPTIRNLTAPYAMINLVKVGLSAIMLLLDAADYLESLGAEFIEWTIAFHDGVDEVAYIWQSVAVAREYVAKTKDISAIEVDIRPIIAPGLGEFERLTSTDAIDPHRPGALVTLNMSGDIFMTYGRKAQPVPEGRTIYEAMLCMAQHVDVSYADFSVEVEMPDVQQVLTGKLPWNYSSSFYLSRRLIGDNHIDDIVNLYSPEVITLLNETGIGITPYYSGHPYSKLSVTSEGPLPFDREAEIVSGYLREALRREVGQ